LKIFLPRIAWLVFLLFYSALIHTITPDFLGLRLAGTVEARRYVRSSFSHGSSAGLGPFSYPTIALPLGWLYMEISQDKTTVKI